MHGPDPLVMTTLDAPTYQTYARTAKALQASTPALLRQTLSGLAPTMAAAADRIAQGQQVDGLRVYAALTCGDLVLGGESRTPLTAEAVRVHAHVAQTVERAQALLEHSQRTYERAAASVDQARTRRSMAP